MSDEGKREQLLAAAERHDVELQRALADLREVVKRPFEVRAQVKTYVADHPLPWLVSAALIGVWLGSR